MKTLRGLALVAVALALLAIAVRPVVAATTQPRSDKRIVACPTATAEQKAGADYLVSGSADDEINNALTDAGTAGSVLVVGGNCDLTAPVRLRTGTRLHCDSLGTALRASAPIDVVVLDGVSVERTSLEHCTINGNKFVVGGLGRGIVIDNTNGSFEYNDPFVVITDVVVKNTGGDGVWVSGRSRATRLDRVRVEKAGGDGFVINAVDSKFSSIESGGAAGYGLRVEGANNSFVNSKFWYSKKSGVYVHGVRNSFANVEAQDNVGHGFEIAYGKNTFSSLQSDSNGWSSGTCTAGTQAGYYIAGASVTLDGIGYDKHESSRNGGLGCQEYGVQFASGSNDVTVLVRVVTYGNWLGSHTGTKPVNALVASGDGK